MYLWLNYQVLEAHGRYRRNQNEDHADHDVMVTFDGFLLTDSHHFHPLK